MFDHDGGAGDVGGVVEDGNGGSGEGEENADGHEEIPDDPFFASRHGIAEKFVAIH